MDVKVGVSPEGREPDAVSAASWPCTSVRLCTVTDLGRLTPLSAVTPLGNAQAVVQLLLWEMHKQKCSYSVGKCTLSCLLCCVSVFGDRRLGMVRF